MTGQDRLNQETVASLREKLCALMIVLEDTSREVLQKLEQEPERLATPGVMLGPQEYARNKEMVEAFKGMMEAFKLFHSILIQLKRRGSEGKRTYVDAMTEFNLLADLSEETSADLTEEASSSSDEESVPENPENTAVKRSWCNLCSIL